MSTLSWNNLNCSAFRLFCFKLFYLKPLFWGPKDASGTSKTKTKLGKLLHVNVDS